MKLEECEGTKGDRRPNLRRRDERSIEQLATPLQTVLGSRIIDCENLKTRYSRNGHNRVLEAGLRGRIREQHRGMRLTRLSPGQRPENQTHLLQGQRLQKAHTAQGDPIQGRKGKSNIRLERSASNNNRRRCSRKESVVMIANNPVMVVKRSPCSTRRRRQPRRSC